MSETLWTEHRRRHKTADRDRHEHLQVTCFAQADDSSSKVFNAGASRLNERLTKWHARANLATRRFDDAGWATGTIGAWIRCAILAGT